MHYRRSPIEIESPEQFGYENIQHNLAESSVSDVHWKDLNINLGDLVLAYGDHLGKLELRQIIVDSAANLQADDVLLTVGAAAALFIISTSLLKTNDHLLVMQPNYATNIETPRMLGAQVEFLPLTFENGFKINVDEIAARITPKTRLVSITCPHNPTGSMLSENELRRLVAVVEEKGCYLLCDETYHDMSFGKPLPLAASLSPRAISVSSLSKSYGLPGIRLGWLICRDPALMETLLAAKEQIFISNSVVDEEIACRNLRDRAARFASIRAHIQTNFAIVRDWMKQQEDMEWVEPSGGVVCFPRIKADSGVDVERFYTILNTVYKTFVGPGHWFEADRRHMRIGYGWPGADELRGGLENISKALMAAKD